MEPVIVVELHRLRYHVELFCYFICLSQMVAVYNSLRPSASVSVCTVGIGGICQHLPSARASPADRVPTKIPLTPVQNTKIAENNSKHVFLFYALCSKNYLTGTSKFIESCICEFCRCCASAGVVRPAWHGGRLVGAARLHPQALDSCVCGELWC